MTRLEQFKLNHVAKLRPKFGDMRAKCRFGVKLLPSPGLRRGQVGEQQKNPTSLSMPLDMYKLNPENPKEQICTASDRTRSAKKGIGIQVHRGISCQFVKNVG